MAEDYYYRVRAMPTFYRVWSVNSAVLTTAHLWMHECYCAGVQTWPTLHYEFHDRALE